MITKAINKNCELSGDAGWAARGKVPHDCHDHVSRFVHIGKIRIILQKHIRIHYSKEPIKFYTASNSVFKRNSIIEVLFIILIKTLNSLRAKNV